MVFYPIHIVALTFNIDLNEPMNSVISDVKLCMYWCLFLMDYAAVLFRLLQPGLTNSSKLRHHQKLLEIQK